MIALLAACGGPDGDRPPGPPDSEAPAHSAPEVDHRFDDCPTFEWLVQVGDVAPDEVHSVEALPGGDVIVAGRYGARPPIGLGEGQVLRPSGNYRDGLVARLGPDGQARWWHTLGSLDMDELRPLTWTPEAFWVAGETDVYGGNPDITLQLDGQDLVPPPWPVTGNLDWGVELGPDGDVRRVRSVTVTSGYGVAATSDPAGNSYLTGFFDAGPVRHGDFEIQPTFAYSTTSTHAYLAAWDPNGHPSWLTVLGRDGTVTQPVGLSWADGKLQWAVEVRPFQNEHGRVDVTRAGGPAAELEVDPAQRGVVLAVDAADGAVLPVRFRMDTNWIYRFEQQPDGLIRTTGYSNPGSRWWSSDGQRHAVPGLGSFAATVGSDGALQRFEAPGNLLYFKTRTGNGRTVNTAMSVSRPLRTVGGGTFTPPDDGIGRDGLLWTAVASGELECVAWFGGPGNQDTFDAVFDELGGIVVVGTFEGVLEVHEPGGLRASYTSRGDPDAFIARFAPR
jgi:hypothetical protein